jgi:hypothetical protein
MFQRVLLAVLGAPTTNACGVEGRPKRRMHDMVLKKLLLPDISWDVV